MWSANSGTEVALANFRKDVRIELFNEAGQLVPRLLMGTHSVFQRMHSGIDSRLKITPTIRRKTLSTIETAFGNCNR